MFGFIRSQPSVVERLLVHIEAAPIVDLIIRIVQLDEQIPDAGVLEVRPTLSLSFYIDPYIKTVVASIGETYSPPSHPLVPKLLTRYSHGRL
jgi:hypothetical protein